MPILPIEITPERSELYSAIQKLACEYYVRSDSEDWIECVSRATEELAAE